VVEFSTSKSFDFYSTKVIGPSVGMVSVVDEDGVTRVGRGSHLEVEVELLEVLVGADDEYPFGRGKRFRVNFVSEIVASGHIRVIFSTAVFANVDPDGVLLSVYAFPSTQLLGLAPNGGSYFETSAVVLSFNRALVSRLHGVAELAPTDIVYESGGVSGLVIERVDSLGPGIYNVIFGSVAGSGLLQFYILVHEGADVGFGGKLGVGVWGEGLNIVGMAYGGYYFVGVGTRGLVPSAVSGYVWSRNGSNWYSGFFDAAEVGGGDIVQFVVWVEDEGYFYAGGTCLVRSVDGYSWELFQSAESLGVGSGNPLTGFVRKGDYYYVCGPGGWLQRSVVGSGGVGGAWVQDPSIVEGSEYNFQCFYDYGGSVYVLVNPISFGGMQGSYLRVLSEGGGVWGKVGVNLPLSNSSGYVAMAIHGDIVVVVGFGKAVWGDISDISLLVWRSVGGISDLSSRSFVGVVYGSTGWCLLDSGGGLWFSGDLESWEYRYPTGGLAASALVYVRGVYLEAGPGGYVKYIEGRELSGSCDVVEGSAKIIWVSLVALLPEGRSYPVLLFTFSKPLEESLALSNINCVPGETNVSNYNLGVPERYTSNSWMVPIMFTIPPDNPQDGVLTVELSGLTNLVYDSVESRELGVVVSPESPVEAPNGLVFFVPEVGGHLYYLDSNLDMPVVSEIVVGGLGSLTWAAGVYFISQIYSAPATDSRVMMIDISDPTASGVTFWELPTDILSWPGGFDKFWGFDTWGLDVEHNFMVALPKRVANAMRGGEAAVAVLIWSQVTGSFEVFSPEGFADFDDGGEVAWVKDAGAGEWFGYSYGGTTSKFYWFKLNRDDISQSVFQSIPIEDGVDLGGGGLLLGPAVMVSDSHIYIPSQDPGVPSFFINALQFDEVQLVQVVAGDVRALVEGEWDILLGTYQTTAYWISSRGVTAGGLRISLEGGVPTGHLWVDPSGVALYEDIAVRWSGAYEVGGDLIYVFPDGMSELLVVDLLIGYAAFVENFSLKSSGEGVIAPKFKTWQQFSDNEVFVFPYNLGWGFIANSTLSVLNPVITREGDWGEALELDASVVVASGKMFACSSSTGKVVMANSSDRVAAKDVDIYLRDAYYSIWIDKPSVFVQTGSWVSDLKVSYEAFLSSTRHPLSSSSTDRTILWELEDPHVVGTGVREPSVLLGELGMFSVPELGTTLADVSINPRQVANDLSITGSDLAAAEFLVISINEVNSPLNIRAVCRGDSSLVAAGQVFFGRVESVRALPRRLFMVAGDGSLEFIFYVRTNGVGDILGQFSWMVYSGLWNGGTLWNSSGRAINKPSTAAELREWSTTLGGVQLYMGESEVEGVDVVDAPIDLIVDRSRLATGVYTFLFISTQDVAWYDYVVLKYDAIFGVEEYRVYRLEGALGIPINDAVYSAGWRSAGTSRVGGNVWAEVPSGLVGTYKGGLSFTPSVSGNILSSGLPSGSSNYLSGMFVYGGDAGVNYLSAMLSLEGGSKVSGVSKSGIFYAVVPTWVEYRRQAPNGHWGPFEVHRYLTKRYMFVWADEYLWIYHESNVLVVRESIDLENSFFGVIGSHFDDTLMYYIGSADATSCRVITYRRGVSRLERTEVVVSFGVSLKGYIGSFNAELVNGKRSPFCVLTEGGGYLVYMRQTESAWVVAPISCSGMVPVSGFVSVVSWVQQGVGVIVQVRFSGTGGVCSMASYGSVWGNYGDYDNFVNWVLGGIPVPGSVYRVDWDTGVRSYYLKFLRFKGGSGGLGVYNFGVVRGVPGTRGSSLPADVVLRDVYYVGSDILLVGSGGFGGGVYLLRVEGNILWHALLGAGDMEVVPGEGDIVSSSTNCWLFRSLELSTSEVVWVGPWLGLSILAGNVTNLKPLVSSVLGYYSASNVLWRSSSVYQIVPYGEL